MRTLSLQAKFELLRRHRWGFDKFAVSTRAYWHRIARYLHTRYPTQTSDIDDVEQQLLLGAWRAAEGFDESRGIPFATHVRWRAIVCAKRWLAKERGCEHHMNKNPPRAPRLTSTGEVPVASAWLWERDPADAWCVLMLDAAITDRSNTVAGGVLGLIRHHAGDVWCAANAVTTHELGELLDVRSTQDAVHVIECAMMAMEADK